MAFYCKLFTFFKITRLLFCFVGVVLFCNNPSCCVSIDNVIQSTESNIVLANITQQFEVGDFKGSRPEKKFFHDEVPWSNSPSAAKLSPCTRELSVVKVSRTGEDLSEFGTFRVFKDVEDIGDFDSIYTTANLSVAKQFELVRNLDIEASRRVTEDLSDFAIVQGLIDIKRIEDFDIIEPSPQLETDAGIDFGFEKYRALPELTRIINDNTKLKNKPKTADISILDKRLLESSNIELSSSASNHVSNFPISKEANMEKEILPRKVRNNIASHKYRRGRKQKTRDLFEREKYLEQQSALKMSQIQQMNTEAAALRQSIAAEIFNTEENIKTEITKALINHLDSDDGMMKKEQTVIEKKVLHDILENVYQQNPCGGAILKRSTVSLLRELNILNQGSI